LNPQIARFTDGRQATSGAAEAAATLGDIHHDHREHHWRHHRRQRRQAAYKKVFWRIMPFLMLCYVIAYLDRVNVGFAKLQMAQDLGFSKPCSAWAPACSSSATSSSRCPATC
jgi:hypothetical protein